MNKDDVFNRSGSIVLTINDENKKRVRRLYDLDFEIRAQEPPDELLDSAEIPRKIHQIYIQHDNTFGTIPSEIKDAQESWSRLNPGYEIRHYNGNDCKRYLQTHFTKEHVDTYDNIQAYSGKCDFMRACIVYNEGGWYADWKTVCLKPLSTLASNRRLQWVSAYDNPNLSKTHGRTFMMTNFFGSIRKHPVLHEFITNIIHNTKTKHYGTNPLDTTGPGCLGKSFETVLHRLDKTRMLIGQFYTTHYTHFNNIPWILGKCDKCTKDQNWEHGNNYVEMWNNRTFYTN